MNMLSSKKILTTIALIGAILLGGSVLFIPQQGGVVSIAHAELPPPNGYQAVYTPTPSEKLVCGGFFGGSIKCFVARFFYEVVYRTFGTLLTISAAFLAVIIEVTIIKFSSWITAVTGVRVAWTILRDVMNITFIFMLLYASISMILGNGKEKGIIKGVIIAGLLINFSYFITSVIIDASNVLTVEMFEAIQRIGDKYKDVPTGGTTDPTITGTFATADGVTNVFMQGLGIQTQSAGGLAPDGTEVETHIFQQLVFSSIAILVIAFVFFAMAFLLLGRFIVLLILLITSPISVMGGLFPQISTHSKKWWTTLIDQAVFAPIMMLFMLVAALIVSDVKFKAGLVGASDIVEVPFAGGVQGMINYAIVIGLLITGMIVAKKSAGAASNGLSDWAIKKAQSMPGTVSGVLGRQFVAPLAKGAGKVYDVGMGRIGQMKVGTYKDAAGNDQRRGIFGRAAVGVGKTYSAIARNTAIDEGVRDVFKNVAGSKFGSQESLADREKARLQRTKELGQAVKDADTDKIIKEGIQKIEELIASHSFDATNEKVKSYLTAVSKLSDSTIEEMLGTKNGVADLTKMAAALTSKHMDKINASTLISDADKAAIGKARETAILRQIDGAQDPDAEVARVAAGKPHEIAQLPGDVLKDPRVAKRLSTGALAKIVSEGKMSDTDRDTVRGELESAISNIPTMEANVLRLQAIPQARRSQQDEATLKRLTLDIKRLKSAEKWLKGDVGSAF